MTPEDDGRRSVASGVSDHTDQVFGGRFRTVQLLKLGQQVVSLLGVDMRLNQQVTIKLVAGSSLGVGAKIRLEHEQQALRQIDSATCCGLEFFGEQDEWLYLVRPHVEGMSLKHRLTQKPLGVLETICVGRCLMTALRQAHDRQVLHRNVKPANVIVNRRLPIVEASLVDFGFWQSGQLARSVGREAAVAARYLSPEQAGVLDDDVCEGSDLYSAGVVLFECLAGHTPFQAETVSEVLRQIMVVPAPELRSIAIDVPRALDDIIQRLLRKHPRDRYQTASAVLADLDAVGEAIESGETDPSIVIGLHDRRQTLAEPAFVGRAIELATLEKELQQAGAGQPRLALVESESGGGKTRLLDELARHGSTRGAWVLRGQALDAAQRPFQMFVGIAEGLVDAVRDNTILRQAIERRLNDHADALTSALPELAALFTDRPDDESQTLESQGPAAFAHTRTLAALAALLDAIGSAERPAMVLLDDCQWADESTVELLQSWWQGRRDRGVGHVMLVAAFRSDEVGPDQALRRIAGATAWLKLPLLQPAEVCLLAESMAGPLPELAIAVVQQLSEGSPFMVSAVLQGMLESGALTSETGGWRVDQEAMSNVQSSRHAAALLLRRVDLLLPSTIQVLTAGAVLGKSFDLHLAARLSDQGITQAIAGVEEARRRRIVWFDLQDMDCSFVHDKLRETFQDRMSPEDRRGLHRRVAELLEESVEPDVFRIAYHFDAAGETQRALPFALSAAQQARNRNALAIAEQHLRIARKGVATADRETQFGIAQGLGDTLMLNGRYEAAALELETALDLADDDLTRARIEGTSAELAFKRGDIKSSLSAYERALQRLRKRVPRSTLGFLTGLAWQAACQTMHSIAPGWFVGRRRRDRERAEADLLAAHLFNRLTYCYWFAAGSVPCLWSHLRGMNLAELYPPGAELAQAYSNHGPVMSLLGWFDRGINYTDRSMDIRVSLGDQWGQGQALHFRGAVLYAASRFQESIAALREAVQLLERTGDFWEMNIARYQIGANLYRMGDLQAAAAEAQCVYRLGIEIGDTQSSGICLDIWELASPGSVPSEALRSELERQRYDPQVTAQVMIAEGRRRLASGDYQEAVSVFERARRQIEAAGIENMFVASVFPWLATALRLQAENLEGRMPARRRALLKKAKRAARKGLRLARKLKNDLPHVLRELGLLEASLGRPARGLKLFEKSRIEAERQGARYELAQTRLAEAEIQHELGQPDADGLVQRRQQEVAAFEASPQQLTGDGVAAELPSLSLVDRFDKVLDSGRKIATGLTKLAILEQVRETALQLLRGEQAIVLDVDQDQTPCRLTPTVGQLDGDWSPSIVRRTLELSAVVVHDARSNVETDETLPLTKSALCAPIFVRGKLLACLYVVHRRVSGLFAEDERRLGEFIASIGGAALENAEGFEKLQQLTETLEQRVEERTAAMEESESRYRELIENANDVILTLDLKGTFTSFNKAGEEVLGYSSDELVGKDVSLILGGEHFEKVQEMMRRKIETRQRTDYEVDVIANSGALVPMEVHSRLIYERGEPTGIQAIARDITERRRYEEQLFAAKEAAEAASKAKSEFLANMSHEIRTPMNAVIGMTELLLDTSLTASQRDYLETVCESAESLMTIINEILDFSKIESGRMELAPVEFELRESLGDIMKSLALRAHEKSLELAWHVDDNVPDSLVADVTKVRQLIVNLVGNAIKFTRQGQVVVRVSCDERTESDASVVFSVADSGIGIPVEKQEAIFNAFEQADASTTRQFGGTGLGLAITKRIVDLMDGRLWVTSQLGSGATFCFRLRFQLGPEQPADLSPPPTLVKTPLLVVDDNAASRGILVAMLESWGFQVDAAADGQEALQLASERAQSGTPHSMLIVDMQMPGMDGLELVQRVRQDARLADLKIIALTSGARPIEADRLANLRVTHQLMKPVKQSELLNFVVSALSDSPSCADDPISDRSEAGIGALRILLAEDGIANQKLAVGMLGGWGHHVTIAENGLEAVQQAMSHSFDLVLMDVQMPMMDGLEATRRIRDWERREGGHLPIVAMTAYAMPGDRDKCIHAGMDGYVAKPVRKRELYGVLSPLFKAASRSRQATLPDASDGDVDAGSWDTQIDWSIAMETVEGDQDLLNDVTQCVLDEVPQRLTALKRAIDDEDFDTIQREAHSLKGTVRLFGDTRFGQTAARLETLRDSPSAAEALYAELVCQWETLLPKLRR